MCFPDQIVMLHCLSLFYEAAWWIGRSSRVLDLFFYLLFFYLLFAALQDQLEWLLKRLKYFFALSFRCFVVALIIRDLSWHLPNYSVHRSYFLFLVNEVQKTGLTEFVYQRLIGNFVCHSLWKWKLFFIENLNSLWKIRWHGD